MKLEFDNFSYLNAKRCEEDFGRKVGPETAPIHSLAACGEVGEMAQEMKRMMDNHPNGKPYPSTEEIERLLMEAADAFTYLDLIASHFGYRFSDMIVKKFNIVSDRVGSKIKIPV